MNIVVSIKQLIASIKKYALSTKSILTNPNYAFRHFGILTQLKFPKLRDVQTSRGAAFWAILLVFLMASVTWLGDFSLDPSGVGAERDDLYMEMPEMDRRGNSLAQMESGNKSLEKDAMLWLSLLGTYNDMSLTTEELMLKFKHLGIASTILGTTANAGQIRKFWSERAIKYSKQSLGVLQGMMPHPDAGELEEVKIRLLIAMALNYYENGKVKKEEIESLFEEISKSFLVRTGFCNNMMLRSLHDDKIIKLPNYLSEKYI